MSTCPAEREWRKNEETHQTSKIISQQKKKRKKKREGDRFKDRKRGPPLQKDRNFMKLLNLMLRMLWAVRAGSPTSVLFILADLGR